MANSGGDKIDSLCTVAEQVRQRLAAGIATDRPTLVALGTDVFGCNDAQGIWQLRDLYDACELAVAQTLAAKPLLGGADLTASLAWGRIAEVEAMTALLPTQTARTEGQIVFQQFSTPAPLALVAALGLRAQPGASILEPSAGTGLLAAAALAWIEAPILHLNELEPRRHALLARSFTPAGLLNTDGARIDNALAGLDAVFLNPPFSRSDGVGEDRHAAARHLVSALRTLRPNGRAVAIMPAWFRADGACGPGHAAVRREGRTLLDLLLPADIYRRQGTSAEVRLMVLERGTGEQAAAQATDLATALELLLHLPELAAEGQARRLVTPVPTGPRTAPSEPPKPAQPHIRADATIATPIDVQILAAPREAADPVGIYVPWRAARHAIVDARPHPTPLVESLAMASVPPPPATYRPMLPDRARSALSDAQLETLILAGDAHGRDLPGLWARVSDDTGLEASAEGESFRQGFFLGDGTGAGKGRQVAGIILDQWVRGKRRHIWLSKSAALIEDARRDWQALGGLGLDIQPLDQWPLGAPIRLDQGILFLTYATLRSARPEKGSRLDQIQAWLRAGDAAFDGVVVFDEAHAMANAAGQGGPRGPQQASEQGLAGLRLQNRNPRARIVYVSATGATDVQNLAYATRLGLWGEGTSFPTRQQFIEKIRASGLAAMELVARDLKGLGLYTARALSFGGVEYEILEHRLSDGQVRTYDSYADAWAIIHRNLDAALAFTSTVDAIDGTTLNAAAKSAALSRFESTKQRFFAQVLMTMKLPSLIEAIEMDLARGDAVVIQLVSTAEAMLNRRLDEADGDQASDLDLDLSPREYLIDYLENAFPVRDMETYVGEDGKERSRPRVDEAGNPILSRQAVELRDGMIETLCALPAVSTALDEIIRTFGSDAVAEVTGRQRRLMTGSDGRQRVERRSGKANLAETEAFMHDRKRILIFSDAGGTGRSYHADVGAPNQRRRIHYLLEPGWRADNAIQGLGRTHRTHQAQPPLFRPVTTDVRGERRFISTIARRLDSLGALTRGQRQTGGQNLFNPADNLESEIATSALNQWFRLLFGGQLNSIDLDRFVELSGLRLEASDGSGALREDLPRTQQWLNRLLAFPIALQNAVFDEYLALLEARVHALEVAGRLDVGLETIRVAALRTIADTIVRTDRATGAETHLLRLEVEQTRHVLSIEKALAEFESTPGMRLLRNARSKRVAIAIPSRSMMGDDGEAIAMVRLIRPGEQQRERVATLAESAWDAIDRRAFESLWRSEAEELAAKPDLRQVWMLTGLLLPIWDKIPGDFIRVLRMTDASGAGHIGRVLDDADVAAFATAMEIDADAVRLTGADIAAALSRGTKRLPVPGRAGLFVQSSLVNGSTRLEITGFDPLGLASFKALGCFTEIIRHKTRLFAPDASVLERLIPAPLSELAA
jgi:plasmid stabilization system protein ParE